MQTHTNITSRKARLVKRQDCGQILGEVKPSVTVKPRQPRQILAQWQGERQGQSSQSPRQAFNALFTV